MVTYFNKNTKQIIEYETEEFAPDFVKVNFKLLSEEERLELNNRNALNFAKQAKINELKNARDTEELSPIEYSGYVWDFDEKAQMRINGAITVLGENTITWTSADNQEIKKVTADDLRGVIGEAALRSNALHIKYRELKAQVEACDVIEDVEKLEW